MTAFRPPPDPDRCRAIVVQGGVRGRCRKLVKVGDLCWECWQYEFKNGDVPRVPERESQP